MIIITDILKEPFDEGAKIATKSLIENIKTRNDGVAVSINSASRLSYIDAYYRLNKLLFNLSFYKTIRGHKHTKILYIPAASGTFFSFIRAKLLNLFTGKDVFVLALQPRKHSLITQGIIRFISPERIITPSYKTAEYFTKIGIQNAILPLGVDDKKYHAFNAGKKRELRDKYIIDQDKIVLLHVGHIQESRNLDWLTFIKKGIPEIEIIVVGSTYNQDNEGLFTKLLENGIRIIREHIPHMEELYNLADYYVFPVLRNDGAIETPLSVIEAMACNLSIITTKFGSLPDTFSEDHDFHYVDNAEEITEIVRKPILPACKNREKIHPFTWGEITRKLVDIVEQ